MDWLFGSGQFVFVLFALAVVLLFMGVKAVPQGYEWTVEIFGRYTRTLDPGLHLIVPFVHRIGKKMNLMEQVLDIPTQEVITADNASITADGVVFFQIINAAQAAYEVRELERAMTNLAMTQLRTVMGSMDLDRLLSEREEINKKLITVVDQATNPWGVKVTRIEIKDITPPPELLDAMARQMKAERDKRAEVLEAEGRRQAKILDAEGTKQAYILEAEGRREAAFRDAEAREREAEAEAKATRDVSEAISNGDVNAVNYFVAQSYVEALGKFAESKQRQTLILPVEATGVLGALSGIGELTKAIGAGGGSAGGPGGGSVPASGSGR